MYRALTEFSDMLDNGYVYRAGDEYPRSGLSVSEQRLRDLASTSNRRGYPMIETVSEEPVKVEETPKTKRGRKKAV